MINIGFVEYASLAALYALWAYPYRYYRIDKTRAHLFGLRNELFSMGAKGEIDFDSDAYRGAEQILNALIRQTHKLDLMRLFFYRLMMRGSPSFGRSSRELHRAVDEYPDLAARNKMVRILDSAEIIAMYHIATSVLPGWVLMQGLLRIVRLDRKIRTFAQNCFKSQIQNIEDEGLIAT